MEQVIRFTLLQFVLHVRVYTTCSPLSRYDDGASKCNRQIAMVCAHVSLCVHVWENQYLQAHAMLILLT